MDKIHIAIVTNNYKPYSGGVVSSIESFTTQLIEFGHKISIITLDFAGHNESDPSYVHRIKCPIKFRYKTNPIGIPWRHNHAVIKKIAELKPDLIHSQHPFLLGKAALKAGKKLKIPIIFTYHTRYEEYAHYLPLPTNISRPIIKKIALRYCKKVDALIAPTQSTKNFLLENGIKIPISIIPSGIPEIFFQPAKKTVISNSFRLLSVSRFTKEKNIIFLLNVLNKLGLHFHLTLVGYGPELENLKNYAFVTLKIPENKLEFIISPTKAELVQIYKNSDIFIFGSKSETQGIVLAEAMASGLPVIALNAPGACDIIENGKNGFLVRNQDKMVEKIEFLQINRELLKKYSENARSTGQKYSISETAAQLINCYQKYTNSAF